MRAARLHAYGPPENLTVEDDVDRPTPGAGELLVRVHATAVNPVDCKMRSGAQRAAVRLKLPAILGMDVSGVVAAVGPGVEGFAIGDAVFSSPSHKRMGCYAEYAVITAAEAAHKPANLSHVEAASVPLVALTAWDSLVDGTGLKAGEKVLVHAGAGGVGSAAIQLAKHLGAHVATTCSGRNAQQVKALGADEVIDYTREDFAERLSAYDVAIDALGGDVRDRTWRVLRRGGRLSTLVSGLPEAAKRYGPYLALVVVALGMVRDVVAARLRGKRFHVALRKADGERLAKLAALYADGTLKPVVDKVFPLDAIVEAHRYQETGHARGKVVIDLLA
jgi:NADPH:quinone reductase-like Zn-dependent oxidoreductase